MRNKKTTMKKTTVWLPPKLHKQIKNNPWGLNQSELIRFAVFKLYQNESSQFSEEPKSKSEEISTQLERIMEKISKLNFRPSTIPDEPLLSILRYKPAPLLELASALEVDPKLLFLKLDLLKKEGRVEVSKDMRWYYNE